MRNTASLLLLVRREAMTANCTIAVEYKALALVAHTHNKTQHTEALAWGHINNTTFYFTAKLKLELGSWKDSALHSWKKVALGHALVDKASVITA